MPNGSLASAVETFSLPIEEFIVALGRGIADAQRALDENSIRIQEGLDADPALAGYGLQANWYQFPRVDLQLKLAISVTSQTLTPSRPTPAAAGPAGAAISSPVLQAARRLSLIAQPVSAAYQTQFNYDAQASSVLTLSIAPVPSPRSGEIGTSAARLTQADVQKAALASPAPFVKDQQGNPVASRRFDINFSAASKKWYVLQYDASNPSSNAVIVSVDDATGVVNVIATPS